MNADAHDHIRRSLAPALERHGRRGAPLIGSRQGAADDWCGCRHVCRENDRHDT